MKRNGLLRMGLGVFWLVTLLGGPALSFVTPEHYEKLKMENKMKAKEAEKTQPPAQGKIQVHPPSEGQPPLGKSNPK